MGSATIQKNPTDFNGFRHVVELAHQLRLVFGFHQLDGERIRVHTRQPLPRCGKALFHQIATEIFRP
jgi:hypothetical protein